MIYHADMYACPEMDVEVLKHLERGKVVSATRIEPPLHPDGPEKVLKDFGIEPEGSTARKGKVMNDWEGIILKYK